MDLSGHVTQWESTQCVGICIFKVFVSHLHIRIVFLWVIYGRCTWFRSVVSASPVLSTGFLPGQWRMQNDCACPCLLSAHSSVLSEGECCWCWGWIGQLVVWSWCNPWDPSNGLQALYQASCLSALELPPYCYISVTHLAPTGLRVLAYLVLCILNVLSMENLQQWCRCFCLFKNKKNNWIFHKIWII